MEGDKAKLPGTGCNTLEGDKAKLPGTGWETLEGDKAKLPGMGCVVAGWWLGSGWLVCGVWWGRGGRVSSGTRTCLLFLRGRRGRRNRQTPAKLAGMTKVKRTLQKCRQG